MKSNPCSTRLFINNWEENKKPFLLKLHGKILNDKKDYQRGVEIGTDGTASLVIWMKLKTNLATEITSKL